jgi:hypothetical protein
MASAEVRAPVQGPSGDVSTVAIAPRGAIATLVLGHGAGAGMDHPFLEGFSRGMEAEGVATVRFNFPYVDRGRRSPDPERVLRETWNAVFASVLARSRGSSVLAGGKSLGGRIASMCVADGMEARGLVFLGYPLHPPGKPERVRADHLSAVEVPMLFLQGTADPFARPDVLAPVLDGLADRATLVRIEGGDHSFRRKGVRADDLEVGAGLAEPAAAFVRRVVAG